MKKLTVIILIIITLLAFVYFYNKIPISKPAQKTQLPIAKTGALDVHVKVILPIPIRIQEGYGHIVEGYKAKDGADRVIIHIQDIHTNYEAQKNMSKIIEGLIKENSLKLIMVEGGWGDVTLSYLRDYADKDRRLEVAEEYLKEGKISGEEYLDIISDYDMDIEGVEEEALYRKNLDIFFKIEGFRKEATQTLEQLTEIINALKQKTYPANLLELEKKHSEYNEEKISLAEFYHYLTKAAEDTHVDMKDLYNFGRFVKIVKLEESIDFTSVEKQRTGLIEKLSSILSKDKLTALVTKSLEFRLNKVSPAEYHTYLRDLTTGVGINFKDYPDLSKYIDYIKSHEEINTNILFKEADTLENNIRDKLVKNPEQKKLQTLARAVEILSNFLNLKLIPDDFAYYKENKNSFLLSGWQPFLKEEMQKYRLDLSLLTDVSILDNNLLVLVEFYDIANQRDGIFIEKATSLMDGKKQKIAVLITGGFHTPNLTKMFKERNISYIVIAPKTTQKTDPELYRYILQYKSGKAE